MRAARLDEHDAQHGALGLQPPGHRQQPARRRRAATGGHVVVDMAMSQFSYGRLDESRGPAQRTPVPAGWDADGNLTTDAAAAIATGRVVPAGY